MGIWTDAIWRTVVAAAMLGGAGACGANAHAAPAASPSNAAPAPATESPPPPETDAVPTLASRPRDPITSRSAGR